MDSDQRKQFEELLTKACDAAIAEGNIIEDGTFNSGEGSLCPIGAVCRNIAEQRNRYDEKLTAILGFFVSREDMWSFIDGFDVDRSEHLFRQDPELYALGQKFRDKYLGQVKENDA